MLEFSWKYSGISVRQLKKCNINRKQDGPVYVHASMQNKTVKC